MMTKKQQKQKTTERSSMDDITDYVPTSYLPSVTLLPLTPNYSVNAPAL